MIESNIEQIPQSVIIVLLVFLIASLLHILFLIRDKKANSRSFVETSFEFSIKKINQEKIFIEPKLQSKNIKTPQFKLYYKDKKLVILAFIVFKQPLSEEYVISTNPISCERPKIDIISSDQKNGISYSLVLEFESIDTEKGNYIVNFLT